MLICADWPSLIQTAHLGPLWSIEESQKGLATKGLWEPKLRFERHQMPILNETVYSKSLFHALHWHPLLHFFKYFHFGFFWGTGIVFWRFLRKCAVLVMIKQTFLLLIKQSCTIMSF